MNLTEIFKRAEKLTVDNSPVLLTGVGVIGTIATAVLSGKASFKAAQIIQAEYDERLEGWAEGTKPGVEPMDIQERIKLVWTLYIPAVGTGALTVASIIASNRIGTRRAVAMAAAYSVSERAFAEYRGKVVERLGTNKEQKLKDELAQDRISRNPSTNKEIFITGSGKVLCYDSLTGRYFESDMETMRKAQNDINALVINQLYASLHEFYEMIGLPPTSYSSEVGWNMGNLCELSYSACLSDDGRPCISVDYLTYPIRDYY